jgi:hypothetical protein
MSLITRLNEQMSLIKSLKVARDPEAYWRSQGWGPKQTFLVERSDADPLMLTLRVPADWTTYDVLKMPADVAATPGSMAQALANLGRVVDRSGVITVLGIARAVEREGMPDTHLFATITVALADLAGPAPESIPGAEVEPVEFDDPRGSYRGVRVRRAQSRAVVADQPPMSFLTVQYLLQTDFGWLAITFATPQHDVFAKLGLLFDKISAAVRLEGEGGE